MTTPEATSNSDIVDVLRGFEAQLIAAFGAGDPSVHTRVLSDDWSVIDLLTLQVSTAAKTLQ